MENSIPDEKKCNKCKEKKSIDQFGKKEKGYQSWCKECLSSYTKERSTINREKLKNNPIDHYTNEKKCTKCKNILPLINFRVSYRNKNGVAAWCKACANDNAKSTRTPEHRRDQHLRQTFNLTQDQYNTLFTEQGGVCACCKQPEHSMINNGRKKGTIRPLAVDHNHTTDIVRALLCHNCNAAYGHLKEDRTRILALLAYHDRFTNHEESTE